MDLQRIHRPLLLASTLAVASVGYGSGFALVEQSVSGLGVAFAGGAASAQDASTLFYNPAGMTYLNGPQVETGLHYLTLKALFHNEGSTTTSTGAYTEGGDSDGGFHTPMPNFYYVQPINDRFSFGLSINCPFGLGTEYDRDWVGRYMAVKSEIQTVDICPSVAYKINDKLSVGLGVDLYYIYANLTNAIDLNKDGTALLDGFSNMEADDTSFGFHGGIIWQASDSTRIGLAYRSQVNTHLKGDVDFTIPDALQSLVGGIFFNQDVGASLNLPRSVSLSVMQGLTDKINLLADITWTDWSVFHMLDINFEDPTTEAVAGNGILENWQDAFRYSVGLTYQLNEKIILRSGLCYDSAAVRGPEYRSPRIPDAERFWVACGLGWKVTESSTLDFAYTHIFVSDPVVDNSIHTSNQRLIGTINARMDIMSLAYTYSF